MDGNNNINVFSVWIFRQEKEESKERSVVGANAD